MYVHVCVFVGVIVCLHVHIKKIFFSTPVHGLYKEKGPGRISHIVTMYYFFKNLFLCSQTN